MTRAARQRRADNRAVATWSRWRSGIDFPVPVLGGRGRVLRAWVLVIGASIPVRGGVRPVVLRRGAGWKLADFRPPAKGSGLSRRIGFIPAVGGGRAWTGEVSPSGRVFQNQKVPAGPRPGFRRNRSSSMGWPGGSTAFRRAEEIGRTFRRTSVMIGLAMVISDMDIRYGKLSLSLSLSLSSRFAAWPYRCAGPLG